MQLEVIVLNVTSGDAGCHWPCLLVGNARGIINSSNGAVFCGMPLLMTWPTDDNTNSHGQSLWKNYLRDLCMTSASECMNELRADELQ